MKISEQLYKIIDAVPASIYWKDTQGVYLGCNQYMLSMAGLKYVSDIIGKTDAELPWKPIADELFKIDQRVIQERIPIEIEETPTLSNQQKRIFLTTKTPLTDENQEVIGVIGISVDISDRKKMEQKLSEARKKAEASDSAKTEFLQNMRHDLRTPFTGILGLSDLMESQETDPLKKENLSYIVQSAKALLDQLNEIFEFIEVESGQLPILDKPFDVYQLLEDVTSMMILPAKNKHLQFSLKIEKEVPATLIGDRVRTQRILMNLISNAIKFTEKGYISVRVQLGKKSKGKVLIHFLVEDTGIGIPEDKHDLIFERFNRLTPAYEGIHRGSGLGLRIVKQFLDEIGGQPNLETTVGQGTRFSVTIPYQLPLLDLSHRKKPQKDFQKNLTPSPFSIPLSQNERARLENTLQSQPKILIVEDHPLAAKIAGDILVSLACRVDIMPNGKMALKCVKEKDYDLIFMDIGLPDINGYEVTRRLRSMNPHPIQTPIIALTGHADPENQQRCMDAGINLMVTKPLRRSEAETILNQFIPNRKKLAESESNNQKEMEPEKIIDFEYAKNLLGGNQQALTEMLTLLLESFPNEVKALKAAYKQQNWEVIGSIAHKLNGGSSYCGTMRLKSVCEKLEEYIQSHKINELAKSSQKKEAQKLYQSLLFEIEAIQQFLTQENIQKNLN